MQHSPQAARQRNFVDCVSLQQRRQGWHCTAELVRLQVQELERAELHELSRDSARQLVEAKVETSQGSEMQVMPSRVSSRAVASQASALRALM